MPFIINVLWVKRSMFRALFAFLFFLSSSVWAAKADVIGISLPIQGRFAPVAQRIEFGALLAVESLKKQGREFELNIVDDGCNPKTAGQTANSLIEGKVKVVVGPLCFKLATELAKALNTTDGSTPLIPVIALDTRNKLLRRYRQIEELPIHSLSNEFDAEAKAVVRHILPRFSGKPFAVLDDDSVYGRALAEQVRLLGEESGLKPVISTNFRPLQSNQLTMLRRLKKSGVEAVFIAAAAEDVVTIAKDMKTLSLDWTIATGEQGQLLPFTAPNEANLDGLLMVQEGDIRPLSGSDAVKENDVERNLLLGYVLVEIASLAIERNLTDLAEQEFDTIIGKIRFDENGRAAPMPFVLKRWNKGRLIDPAGN